MNLINELFYSDNRKLVDKEIERLLKEKTTNKELLRNILYHLKIRQDNIQLPTLEHSKRLRSFLCLQFGIENNFKVEEILPLAITVELIHNSTLIVDDIQDNTDARCGELALWRKIGIPQAMNVSFYLSNLAQSIFHEYRTEKRYFNYSTIITETISDLFNGQQIDLEINDNKSIEKYEEMAFGKTGSLLLLSSLFGAMPYHFDFDKFTLMKQFFKYFSCYYQIRDDISDIETNSTLDIGNIKNYLINNETDLIKSLQNEYETKSIEIIELMIGNKILTTNKIKKIIETL